MIQAENVSYSIDRNVLLRGISITCEPGKITMIVGPNGAGKSTLIKLLSQQWPCTTGSIRFNGRDISGMSKEDLARNRAVLSQNINMVFPLSVEEVVMMGRYPHFESHPTDLDKDICRETMDIFEVSEMAERNYLTLSGGERQRVHFARVTAQIWPESNQATKILLLDEPLAHLDIYYQYELLSRLKKLMSQQSMVVIGVVHDLNLAHKFADEVLLLLDGKMLSYGDTEHVFTRENIKEAFGMEASFLMDNRGKRFLCF